MARELDWDGCHHVRDLGGLRTVDGRETRRGAVVRAGTLDRISESGWATLEAYGVRTIVDLRNADERPQTPATVPEGVSVVEVELDGIRDHEFWDVWASGPQFGTPLYYGPFLEHFPERAARAVAAIAQAPPGGVVVHCGRGRDRVGLISMLVLALAGVEPAEIAADYELSAGDDAADREIAEFLARMGTSGGAVIELMLASLDVEATLRAGGLADGDVAAVRERLLG